MNFINLNKKLLLKRKNLLKDNNIKEKEYNIKYVYTYGDSYRGGIHYGHKNCIDHWISIPKSKGWITEEYITEQRLKTSEKRLHSGQEEDKRANHSMAFAKATTKKRDGRSEGFIPNHSNTSIIKDPMTEAVPVIEVKKTKSVYTITMNSMMDGGRPNPAEEPVVFKLGTRKDIAERVSSCSSLEFECFPPAAFNALRPKITQRDVYTSYDREHFTPTEKNKRGDKKVPTPVLKI